MYHNNRKGSGGSNKNMMGIISIIIWAGLTYPKLDEADSARFDTRIEQLTAQLDALPDEDEGRAALEEQITRLEEEKGAAELAYSYAGRLGKAIEPLTLTAGFEWRTDIALLAGVAAKEAVVSTMGTAYSLGDVDPEDSQNLGQLWQQGDVRAGLVVLPLAHRLRGHPQLLRQFVLFQPLVPAQGGNSLSQRGLHNHLSFPFLPLPYPLALQNGRAHPLSGPQSAQPNGDYPLNQRLRGANIGAKTGCGPNSRSPFAHFTFFSAASTLSWQGIRSRRGKVCSNQPRSALAWSTGSWDR